jgi:hypothetical protein
MIATERLASIEKIEHRRGPIAGVVCIALAALFLTFDSVLKVLSLRPAVEGTIALGYPVELVQWIGIAELVCVAVYLVPRTSVLGGLLLTGYLGALPDLCSHRALAWTVSTRPTIAATPATCAVNPTAD